MDSQTSVLMMSAPLHAATGSSVSVTFGAFTLFMKSAGGWQLFGAAMTSSKPRYLAAHIHERDMLLSPSPMNTIFLPTHVPHFSLTVSRSARIWHGCSSSVRALIVGMFPNSAKSTTSCWAKVLMMQPWTILPSTRAVSLIGSPLPSWMSFEDRNIMEPPSSRTPTSKDTRVLVDDFVKIIAQVCPANGSDVGLPRSALIFTAEFTSSLRSSALSSSIESK